MKTILFKKKKKKTKTKNQYIKNLVLHKQPPQQQQHPRGFPFLPFLPIL